MVNIFSTIADTSEYISKSLGCLHERLLIKFSHEGFHDPWNIGGFLLILAFCTLIISMILAAVFYSCCPELLHPPPHPPPQDQPATTVQSVQCAISTASVPKTPVDESFTVVEMPPEEPAKPEEVKKSRRVPRTRLTRPRTTSRKSLRSSANF